MRDLKDRYQQRADELAAELYGIDFYDLPDKLQYEVYSQAEADVNDQIVGEAEHLCDMKRGL